MTIGVFFYGEKRADSCQGQMGRGINSNESGFEQWKVWGLNDEDNGNGCGQ